MVQDARCFRFLVLICAPCSLVLGFFGCLSCDLDVICTGGMEFCYLEFCLNFMFWSCHPVPVDPSGDCIRVLCWDEF